MVSLTEKGSVLVRPMYQAVGLMLGGMGKELRLW